MIVNLAILLEWIRVRLSSWSFFNYVGNVGRGTENVNVGRGTENVNNTKIFPNIIVK